MAPQPADLRPAAAVAALAVPPGEKKSGSVPAPSLAQLELEEGPVRYAGYAGRVAQFVRGAERVSSVRHLAYASDVGEAFRPTVPRWAVNATYGIAVGYVAADVVSQSAKASLAGADRTEVARVAAQTTTFQLLASILTPFVAIHSQVALFSKLLKNTPAAKFGPSAAGLALIPFLPLVDEPIEHAVEQAFGALWPRSAEQAAAHAVVASSHHEQHTKQA